MGALLGSLLVAAAVAGCSSNDAAAPAPPPPPAADPAPAPPAADAPPASEDEPEPPADDEPAPASDDEPAEASAPAPEPPPARSPPRRRDDAAAADPSDAYFALDRVLDVSIEIDPADWDTLRNQTRTFEDLMAEIEEYNLSRPFASIYTWFSGTVTIDGETHGEVGVRKKGFLGSMSDTKPSLKLRFDKYVDDQALGGVIERMTLNNSIQDPSMVNTCLSYRVFAATGSPASRCNFATVSVNGKNLGLYVHVEEIKKPFLARHFDSAEGQPLRGHGQRLHAGVPRHHREEDQRGRRRLVRHRRLGGGPGGPVPGRPGGAGRDRGPGPVPVVLGDGGADRPLGRLRRRPQQLPLLP